ncbi:MAG TPA: virulence-associated E family protein, partial [Polyangiaceae bacterium]
MSTEIEVVPLVLGRNKEPKPTSTNVAIVLAALGDAIRYEAHSRRIVCGGIGSTFPAGVWIDNHTTALVQLCEARGIDASPSTVDRAVALHAHRHRYNALTDFLMQCALEWDDVARLDAALCTYWHAEDTEATRITSRVFLLSLAARGLEPGCKVDTCVAFVGDQGERKSSALAALVGKQWFSDSPLPIGDKDGMQNLPGKWLWEFGENASLSRREVEQVKQFLSTQQDHYRASYGRHAETVLRQICFAASTNKIEYLTDPTGNRRHLPVSVSDIDLAGIERDRLQLIGEAAARVLSEERYWLSKDE